MSDDCQKFSEAIVEQVARLGREPRWDEAVAQHLEQCQLCRQLLRDELELCRLLEEPVPLPPADLINGVMARLSAAAEPPEPRAETALPWAERFAWAASGAAAMYGLERLPDLSGAWLGELQAAFFSVLGALAIPFEINGLYLLVLALTLFVAQGAMVYQVRSSAS